MCKALTKTPNALLKALTYSCLHRKTRYPCLHTRSTTPEWQRLFKFLFDTPKLTVSALFVAMAACADHTSQRRVFRLRQVGAPRARVTVLLRCGFMARRPNLIKRKMYRELGADSKQDKSEYAGEYHEARTGARRQPEVRRPLCCEAPRVIHFRAL